MILKWEKDYINYEFMPANVKIDATFSNNNNKKMKIKDKKQARKYKIESVEWRDFRKLL